LSKLSAPQFRPASWIVATVVIAVAMIALGSAVSRQHRSEVRKIAAPVASTPVLSAGQRAKISARFDALPVAFEANRGQSDPRVKYMTRGSGYTLFLTANEAVFAVRSAGSAKKYAGPLHEAAIRMQTVGGNTHALITAGAELPGTINYYRGNDRSKWVDGAKQYAGVTYREVYPGVNLAYHGEQRQLEFDFIVAPGASTAPIELGFEGAKKTSTDTSGNLLLTSSDGDVLLHRPVAYQEKNGRRELVDVSFKTSGKKEVSFALGAYDHSRELVIDPSVTFATYLGGSGEDDGYAIAIDGSGNSYVTGQTKSTNFPTVAGAHSTTNAGGFDVFVTKLSADGSSLVFSTYVGGSGDDSGNAIAVDGSGNVFVAGGTGSSNFPTTTGALQTTFGGGSLDAFVFELASSGGSLVYSTYLGGSGNDAALGMALDGSGNTYIVGLTYSPNFPTHNAGALQGSLAGASNGFVSKLNSSGNALTFSTYLGGGTGDFASAVALDSSNNVYVTGATQNSSFPTTTGAFQTSCGTAANCNGGLSDAFVTVIKADASGYVYSSFLGGGSADQGLGIAVDSAGDAYVTGLTQSSDFPKKSPIQATYGGGTQDAFVTAVNPSGSTLLYSTYLGGSLADAGAGIAVDSNKNVYVTGQTASSNFPTVAATQSTLGGGNDAFITEINAAGSQIKFSTFLGGLMNEDSTSTGASVSPLGSIAVDSAGANIYVVGNTASTNFPTVNAKQGSSGGSFDAFVAKYASAGTSGGSFTVGNGALSATSGSAGASATSTITVTSTGGFNSAVTLSCTVAPVVAKGPTCSFSNPGSSVTPPANGSVTATLNIATTAPTTALLAPSNGHRSGWTYALLLPFAGLLLLGTGFRSADAGKTKLIATMMLLAVVMGLLLLPSCGGSSNSGGGGGTSSGTPSGAYTFTITGTSGGTVVTGTPALTFTVN